MNPTLSKNLEPELRPFFGNSFSIKTIEPVSGGDINQAYLLDSSQGTFFIKLNLKHKFPNLFKSEKAGLDLMRKNTSLTVPNGLLFGEVGDYSFLIMEYIMQGEKQTNFWQQLGSGLAELHQATQSSFGLSHDNYIGTLPQQNKKHVEWVDFFINERLKPQIKLAKGQLSKKLLAKFDKLFDLLPNIFPIEKPALVHGDLWGGNYLCSSNGKPVLIDPAVYYGHREMDLAMTKLFGGFSNDLYENYHSAFPLENGWEERINICNLYPLLVHVNLFGSSYVSSVANILSRFI